MVLAWLAAVPASAAPFDPRQLDAMLRQDGFVPEHPSDNLWSVGFHAGTLGDFPLCLALSADKSELVMFVRVDQAGIDPTPELTHAVRDLNRTLGRTSVRFDAQGSLIVHQQTGAGGLGAKSLQREINNAGWAAVAVFMKVQPSLHSSEIKCAPYLAP